MPNLSPPTALFAASIIASGMALAQTGRSVSALVPPQLGQPATFEMHHPVTASGRVNIFMLTTHTPAVQQIQIPGFTSSGSMRIDPTGILDSFVTILDNTGVTSLTVAIPNVPAASGYEIDTQTIDADFAVGDLAWSDNDVESVVAPTTLSWATTLEAFPNAAVVIDAGVRADIVATGFPWRVADSATGIEMILVPPGTFIMGASPGDPSADSDEFPQHSVTLTQTFYMSKTEVTQSQWLAQMGSNPSVNSGTTNPVDTVSWLDVQPFCSQTSMRLPTEAEWEYACRAGTTAPTYGPLNSIAWTQSNSGGVSHPVGAKLPNGFGLHDMIGNVWEMTQDWYGPYSAASATNPTGPASGTHHPLRGGSWFYFDFFARSSSRKLGIPFGRLDNLGFRVARDPQ